MPEIATANAGIAAHNPRGELAGVVAGALVDVEAEALDGCRTIERPVRRYGIKMAGTNNTQPRPVHARIVEHGNLENYQKVTLCRQLVNDY